MPSTNCALKVVFRLDIQTLHLVLEIVRHFNDRLLREMGFEPITETPALPFETYTFHNVHQCGQLVFNQILLPSEAFCVGFGRTSYPCIFKRTLMVLNVVFETTMGLLLIRYSPLGQPPATLHLSNPTIQRYNILLKVPNVL